MRVLVSHVACFTIRNGACGATRAFSLHTKYISPLLQSCLHLTGSYFLLTWGWILPVMAEAVCISSGSSLKATQLLHALIFFFYSFFFFFFLVLLLRLHLFPFFIFSVFRSQLSPFLSKSLGSLWWHSMHHHSSGGRSVLLHSGVTGFCSTKDVTISCCVLELTSKEDATVEGAGGQRWRLLLLK